MFISSRPRSVPARVRSAFTMVELITVISIFAVVISLLLPAVQRARETARAVSCQSNLRQLALASLEFESKHGRFPVGVDHKYSLLPSLEQSAIFESKGPADPMDLTSQWDPIGHHALPIFLCPSDPSDPVHQEVGGTNYHGNAGTGVLADGFNGIFGHGEGLVAGDVKDGVQAAMIRDGLSHTAAFSEAIRLGTPERLTQIWLLPETRWNGSEQDELKRECDALPFDPQAQSFWHASKPRGYPWYGGGIGVALYNHLLSPNRPSCSNGMEVLSGAYTATSHHPGGVHVAFCDGHIVFINQSIDSRIWQDFGSRDSNRASY